MAKVLSKDDKDLGSKSIRTTRSKLYTDIDLTLAKNSSTGDIFRKKDAASVKQAVMNLVQTSRFEKPFKPGFGADITNQLFELANAETGIEIENQIRNSLERFEPRAVIRELLVKSNSDQNSINVFLEFQVVNTNEIVSFETTLSRLR